MTRTNPRTLHRFVATWLYPCPAWPRDHIPPRPFFGLTRKTEELMSVRTYHLHDIDSGMCVDAAPHGETFSFSPNNACIVQETKVGAENVVTRKHASIRFETATGAFEVQLEDIPAVFAVSHATGR